jgi:hypothetical protein
VSVRLKWFLCDFFKVSLAHQHSNPNEVKFLNEGHSRTFVTLKREALKHVHAIIVMWGFRQKGKTFVWYFLCDWACSRDTKFDFLVKDMLFLKCGTLKVTCSFPWWIKRHWAGFTSSTLTMRENKPNFEVLCSFQARSQNFEKRLLASPCRH